MKKREFINFNMLGIVSCGVFALVMLVSFTPSLTMTNPALAEEVRVEAGVDLTANVRATVAISVEDEVSIDITPTADVAGIFSYGKSRMTVITNNMSGYSIYLRTQGLTNNLMPARLPATDDSITPVADGTVGANFPSNTWGYNIDEPRDNADASTLTYYAVPSLENKIIYATETANADRADTYDLTFGVNVNATLPANTYTNSVLVSAVANPKILSSLYDVDYMQDVTSKICEDTPLEFTKRLIDARNGAKYWVAKLRDGNCWMTQNLALDLSTSKTLTPSDTDVTANWTPNSNTDAYNLNGTRVNTPSQTTQYSWGKWKNTVLATPEFARRCSRSTDGDGNSVLSSEQLSASCSGEGFVDVSESDWKPTYVAQPGTIQLSAGNTVDSKSTSPAYPYDYSGLITVDYDSKTYDAHYLVGNYYQYNTATANTGNSVTVGNATSSICPKGWTLPRSGHQDNIIGSYDTSNGTYNNLFNAYGLLGSVSSTAGNKTVTLRNYDIPLTATSVIDGETTTYQVSTNQYNIAGNPLYFVRSGNIYLYDGYLRNAGLLATAWTRSASASGTAHYVYIDNGSAGASISSNGNMRYSGYPVRCLVR